MSETTQPQPDPGTICWNEICTPDRAGTIEFYSRLLGWTTEDMEMPGGSTYTMFKQGDTMVAGCIQPDKPGAPTMWMNYILVEDLDAAAARAVELGATICIERVDLPMGSFVTIVDPQGAMISFWENGETEC